ncbi:MAG TPA: response regulator [Kofleriaceae bacterium]
MRFRDGDFSARMPSDLTGIDGKIADVVNDLLAVSERRSAETARVCRVVGKEGKLKERMRVPGAGGGWADEVAALNTLIDDLVWPTTEVTRAVGAVAKGDLGQAMALEVDGRALEGEFLRSAQLVNKMIEQLSVFTSEVTRVAREVGTEGKLGGQAQVKGVSGVWKDLTESVNQMAGNLTAQVRNIAEVTIAVASGDLSKKITVDVRGEILQLKEAINTMVEQLRSFASEVTRVAREVGTEGKLGGQAVVPGVAGTWKDLTDNVNAMASNLTGQVRNIAEVTTAVARGDLSRKITVDVKGEILELKNTINTMVDQLRSFASEVTRVAREVGTEGKLGGQADVPGVAGTWKDLTDSVNFMAANLTNQVRGIVKVVTAVANGNLRQKLTVEAKGEVAALAETINNMTDTLATFAEQVTNVAREVGVDGRLGGQANVPGAAGTWKDLTGNVNLLAANLTNQVRAIADVATAVTKGDLTRSIQVEARGEVAELKDNINTMIDNLRGTTDRNQEQDWLKTNLAKFTGMLQGQRDLVTVGKMLLTQLAPLVDAQQGTVYQLDRGDPGEHKMLRRLAAYAQHESLPERVGVGIGLVGQAAAEKQRILLSDVPPTYMYIHSSLGTAPPKNIVVLPVLFEGETMAVIELASLRPFTNTHLAFLDQLTQSIGVVLNTIDATMRTENLLQQSQQLTAELQTRQIELQRTNEELASKAKQLAEQNEEVERKNKEVEHARRALEEKAAELALTSKYKSEFLANMSHELRTPLNSILILGQQLADNSGKNLTDKQVEFAKNIHSAGTDLLTLINDILDLSKIESGTVTVEPEDIPFASLRDTVHRTFHHIAENKNLAFNVEIDSALPRTFMCDPKRLQQILKNLLSNAFKFTAQGYVSLSVRHVTSGWSSDHPVLSQTGSAVAFMVADTGIGIANEKQKLIFEAFQQADAGTSRKYGGTGLGLAISRELATLLGGEIRLVSKAGQGSTFTLYLPLAYTGPSHRLLAPTNAPHPMRQQVPVLTIAKTEETVPDDRADVRAGDSVLLVVEDDPHYARILLGIARNKGFKGVVASRGQQALALTREYLPTAVTLDVFLPDMLGWTVLNNLKLDPRTRHIPVQMLSVEEERQHGLAHGAFSYLVKPATTGELEHAIERLSSYVAPHTKRLLVIEDNDRERQSIVELLGHTDIEVEAVSTGAGALATLRAREFDCCVVDLRLPDMTGFELLEKLQAEPELRAIPIVVFTGKELSADEQRRLRDVAKSVVLKDVQSPERLLDETALFLHRVITDLPEEKRRMIERLHGSTEALRGRRVLVVDDDVRNIFALTTVLESQEMEVLSATNGRQAIELIERTPDLGVVLMDIMMPEMDGYETMREIRKSSKFRTLPILALTAKAMKGDREKCLEAGASDYIAKPVNTDQLLSLLRVWLYR